MNVQEVVTRVKRTFGDEAGVQISDLDVIRWINDAQEQIVERNDGLMEATATADTVVNVAEYDFPANLSVLRSLKYKGFRIKSLSFAEFNEYIDGYSAPDSATNYGPGTPEVFMVWESKITLFPRPNVSTTAGLSIYYVRHPTAVANLADSLSVPSQYHNSIVNYCLQQAYELDEDFTKAGFKKSQFDETMTNLSERNKWASQEYYPRITTLPQDEMYGEGGFYGGY